jgi:hypothetical protein
MSTLKSMKQYSRKKDAGHRNFFSKWTRRSSDNLRWRLLQAMGFEGERVSNYDLLSSLPEVRWDTRSLQQNLTVLQMKALFSKDEDLLSPVDREAVAFESFLLSERSCKQVNDLLETRGFGSKQTDVDCILFYAQRKISMILGEAPTLDELDLVFGPGATTSCKKNTSARWKLSTIPSISRAAVKVLPDLIRTLPHIFRLHKKVVVETGELAFVPKNFKTHRSICVEPTISAMVQKGIGTFLKQKLLRAGVNLMDQNINKRRARTGSLNGAYTTIDLERASDSVSSGMVGELLPIQWFELLSTYRTDTVRYKDQLYQLEKFSSMGNGFTFELESLIFYALGFGIASHFKLPFDLTVYGDDIVTTPSLSQKIYEYFPHFGFNINVAKSFSQGPFRESCGGDYYLGLDVRPFFIRDRLSIGKLFSFYNFLFRKPWFDPKHKLRDLILESIPERDRLWGPDTFGDGHLLCDDPTKYAKPHGRKFGYEGYTFDTVVAVPNRDETPVIGDALLPAYSAGRSGGIPPVDSVWNGNLRQITSLCYHTKQYFLGYLREVITDVTLGGATDHFALRANRKKHQLSKKVRVYVLGTP